MKYIVNLFIYFKHESIPSFDQFLLCLRPAMQTRACRAKQCVFCINSKTLFHQFAGEKTEQPHFWAMVECTNIFTKIRNLLVWVCAEFGTVTSVRQGDVKIPFPQFQLINTVKKLHFQSVLSHRKQQNDKIPTHINIGTLLVELISSEFLNSFTKRLIEFLLVLHISRRHVSLE